MSKISESLAQISTDSARKSECKTQAETSELPTIRPQCPSGTIILCPQQCHPERSEGSAVAFGSSKVTLLPSRRPSAHLGKEQISLLSRGGCDASLPVCSFPVPFAALSNTQRSCPKHLGTMAGNNTVRSSTSNGREDLARQEREASGLFRST